MEFLELLTIPCLCFEIYEDSSNLESSLKELDKKLKSLVDLRDESRAKAWLDSVSKVEKSVESVREKVAVRAKSKRARTYYAESKWRTRVCNEVDVLLVEINKLHKQCMVASK